MRKVVLYSILCILILYVSEKVLELPYLIKTLVKLPLFTVYPLIQLKKCKHSMKVVNLKSICLIASFVFIVIMTAFVILNSFIDFGMIQMDFAGRMAITPTMFLWASIYTIFVNALIEEIFFRGYIFLNMRKNNKRVANLFSAGLFSVYHLTIFNAWFSLPILSLVLVGLFVGGLIFNYFAELSESIMSPYIIHIAADIAIVLIGYKVLYLG